MSSERRSVLTAADQLGLWPETDSRSPDSGAPIGGAHRGGVGGRRRPGSVRRGGGGYLDGRTPAELRADPRLRELAEIGLAAHWLAVASIVGYDAFIAMWRLLSSDPALRNDDSQIELYLRPFKSYERYQRNRYIDTLVMAGLRPSLILDMVRQDLGENLSHRHIRRLAARGRSQGIGEAGPPCHPWRAAEADTVPE